MFAYVLGALVFGYFFLASKPAGAAGSASSVPKTATDPPLTPPDPPWGFMTGGQGAASIALGMADVSIGYQDVSSNGAATVMVNVTSVGPSTVTGTVSNIMDPQNLDPNSQPGGYTNGQTITAPLSAVGGASVQPPATSATAAGIYGLRSYVGAPELVEVEWLGEHDLATGAPIVYTPNGARFLYLGE